MFQGDIFSPVAFIAGLIFSTHDNSDAEIRLGADPHSVNVSSLEYADDSGLVDVDPGNASLNGKLRKTRLRMCFSKAKKIDNVQSFVYLGSKQQCDGDDVAEVKHRMNIAQEEFSGLWAFWQDKQLPSL